MMTYQERDICSTIVSIDEFGVLKTQLPLRLEPFVSGSQWAALVDEVKVHAVKNNNVGVCFLAMWCLLPVMLPVIIIYVFFLGDGPIFSLFIFVPFLLIPLLFLRMVCKGPKGERWREQMQSIAERTSTQLVHHQHKFVSVHFQWTVLYHRRRRHDSDDDHDRGEVYYCFEFLHGSNSATASTTVVGRGVGAITNPTQPVEDSGQASLDVLSSRQSTTTATPLAMTNSNGSTTTTTRINVNFGYRVDRTLPLSLESLVSMAKWQSFLDQVDAVKNLETGKRLRHYQSMGLLMIVFFFELLVGVALCINTTIISFSWWLCLVFPVMVVPLVLLCGRVKKMGRLLCEQMHAIAAHTTFSKLISVRFQPPAPDKDKEEGYTEVREEKFSTKQPYFEFTHHHSSPLLSFEVAASVEWPGASPPYYGNGGDDDADAARSTIPTVEDDLESNTTLRFGI
jgi:hypothetical protein